MARRSTFFHHLHPPTLPRRAARFRYTFGLGGAAVFLFGVLVVTGLLEMFYYVPSLERANASVQLLTFLVPYGWLVRGVHYWAAQGLVVIAVLHLLRVVLTGAYKSPRRFNWLLGVSLLVLVVLLDFTGYVLRWDTDIEWALLVGTNLLKSIPLIGESLYGLVVGGSEVSGDTIVRFYAWHVFGLALIAAVTIGWHIFRVRRDGGISTPEPRTPDRITRDDLVKREVVAMLLLAAVLLLLALVFPPELGPAGDFSQLPGEASAPWFFVWVQQLLRWGDPLPMGLLIPIGLVVVLFLIPYVIDRRSTGVGRWFNREGRVAQWVTLVLLASIVALTVLGSVK
ncbi:ubiquinol-cytochrome c reductase cytochrome b subunit [Thermoflexales bacterium]|nr:ubiquinol-cytochrome c reductase cytochrome b subunit [Thermoflexales bacterium]